jgi:two-component system chemotaxis response regulator CheB
VVRVLVVDDSAFMRRLLSDLLSNSGRLQVVGTARNGEDAVAKNLKLQPDVITLDVEMPVMDGLQALRRLLATRPVPVVMVSSLTQTGANTTLEALSLGAVDFVGKPDSPMLLHDLSISGSLVDKVLQAATVDVRKLINALPSVAPRPTLRKVRGTVELVGIGTSTGGPRALQQVIPGLPADGRAAYLVVQHMPKGFTRSLAERLNALSALQVVEAEDQLCILADYVYIAPGGYHMLVTLDAAGRPAIRLSEQDPVNGHRPSVDVLFQSLADIARHCRAAALLTGMGADGAAGLLHLRQAGVYTVAEDASTAVIFGMPRAAIALGAAEQVAPLSAIGEAILQGRQ